MQNVHVSTELLRYGKILLIPFQKSGRWEVSYFRQIMVIGLPSTVLPWHCLVDSRRTDNIAPLDATGCLPTPGMLPEQG